MLRRPFRFTPAQRRELLRLLRKGQRATLSTTASPEDLAEERSAIANGQKPRSSQMLNVAIKQIELDIDCFYVSCASGESELKARKKLLAALLHRFTDTLNIPATKSESGSLYQIFHTVLEFAGYKLKDCYAIVANAIDESTELPHLRSLMITADEKEAYAIDAHERAAARRQHAHDVAKGLKKKTNN